MSKSRRKPPITVAKATDGYGLRVGASRAGVFETKEAAVDAAKELARSGQGTFSMVSTPSQSFAPNSASKRVVRTYRGTWSSKPRPDGGEPGLNRNDPGVKHPPSQIYRATIHVPTAHPRVATELAQYMNKEAAKARRMGVLSGLSVLAGLLGAITTAVASILMDSPTNTDAPLLVGLGTVAAAAAILTMIIPGLLKSRTITNAWAAKVAGVVWDDEMARTNEVTGRH